MNINMNTSASLAQNTSDVIGLTVLKKAINIEAQNAMALINTIPQPPQQGAANLSPYLGQNINTIA
ncbi:MAG: putative motility protein [Nitrosomonadaceae bacterium]|nr:putative motility protein [Nitrosomonadaceae bacterium]